MMAVYVVCFLLILPVSFAIFYRSLFLGGRQCLQCGSHIALDRIPRSRFERTLGRFIPNRRYRCGQCGWIGLIRENVARQGSEALTETDGDIKTITDQTPVPTSKVEQHPSAT